MYPHLIFDHNKIVAAGLISLDRSGAGSGAGADHKERRSGARLGTQNISGEGREFRVSECRFLLSYS